MENRFMDSGGGKKWVLPLGLSFVCLALAVPIGLSNTLGMALLLLSVVGLIVALTFAITARVSFNRYSLKGLQKVHEQKELEAIEDSFVSSDADRIVCVRCGGDYASRIPVCPHCGHS